MLITNKACIPDPLIRILQERGQSAEPRSLCLSCWSIICNAISKYKRKLSKSFELHVIVLSYGLLTFEV